MKYRLLIAALLAAGVPAQAQTADPAGTPVSLRTCVDEALTHNPALQSSAARADAAEARSREAGTALLPQVRFTGRAMELSSVPVFTIAVPPPIGPLTLFPSITESYSAKITVQQPLFAGFRLTKNREAASYQADATREDLRRDRDELVLNVTTAYWNLYRARRTQEAVRQAVEQLNEHLRDVRNFAAQGLATDADVLKVQAQRAETVVRSIETDNAVRVAGMMLNSLMGRPVTAPLIPSDSLAAPDSGSTEVMPSLESLTARAHETRPEMRSVDLRRRMGEAGVTAARAGWFPQISFAADYEYARPNARIIPPKDRWDGTWDVGLLMQWNVWDWMATSHQTAQAEAALRQAEAGVAQTSDAVAIDVAQQYYAVIAARSKVVASTDGLRQASEVRRMTHDRYRQGLATSTDLLDAETMLLQASVTYTNSLVDLALAQVRLRRAAGDAL